MSEQQPEAPAIPGVITLDELAEAFDHEIDGCYVGGREFAVNVFAYVRDHRPAPEFLVTPPAPAEDWTPEQLTDFQAHFEAAMANSGPLRVLPSDHWKYRAEAAEAKVAEIDAMCRDIAASVKHGATPVVAVERVLAITGSDEEEGRG